MAVQKSRVTTSKRGMRRAHDSLTTTTVSVDKTSGESHRRHHISRGCYYRGRKVVETPAADKPAE